MLADMGSDWPVPVFQRSPRIDHISSLAAHADPHGLGGQRRGAPPSIRR